MALYHDSKFSASCLHISEIELASTALITHVYTVVRKKTCHFYFLNSFMKHWPILLIFGLQPKYFPTLPCEMQKS